MNGHMERKNVLFKNFKFINFLNGAQNRRMCGDPSGKWRQIGANLLKKY